MLPQPLPRLFVILLTELSAVLPLLLSHSTFRAVSTAALAYHSQLSHLPHSGQLTQDFTIDNHESTSPMTSARDSVSDASPLAETELAMSTSSTIADRCRAWLDTELENQTPREAAEKLQEQPKLSPEHLTPGGTHGHQDECEEPAKHTCGIDVEALEANLEAEISLLEQSIRPLSDADGGAVHDLETDVDNVLGEASGVLEEAPAVTVQQLERSLVEEQGNTHTNSLSASTSLMLVFLELL